MVRKLKNIELNRLSVEEFRTTDKMNVVLVLDNIRSALNVGSIFRTADAFTVKSLYLCGITASPPNNELRKTALGAEESVDWKHFPSTIEAITALKDEGYSIMAIEQTSSSLIINNFTPEAGVKYALILGNEVHGVSEDCLPLCDKYLEIPQAGSKHSLNVAVSAGIVTWHFFQHLYK